MNGKSVATFTLVFTIANGLTCSLVEAELEHSASLSGAVTALRQDEHKRMTEAVEKIKSEEEVGMPITLSGDG